MPDLLNEPSEIKKQEEQQEPQLRILLTDQPLPEKKPPTRAQTLYHHFFRRFFDNDTLSVEGETQSTVVRVLAFIAVPALMFAFWLLPAYGSFPPRPLRLIEADRYFFVLYSFIVMGAITTFEWEMLFPDRADFLILLPMPLHSRELFLAKARALLTLLGLFFVAANAFGLILFPAVSTTSHGNYFATVWPHFVAVTFAGAFSAFSMLAIEGLSLCLLPSAWYRLFSTAIQLGSITLFVLLFLLYPLVAGRINLLLQNPPPLANFLPPLWFMALYEHILGDASASSHLVHLALWATPVGTLVAVIAYPFAWARQKKRAIEGASRSNRPARKILTPLLHRTILRHPQQRAIFHFITQTLFRSTRYQIYLTLYAGVGLALALCTILTLQPAAGSTASPSLVLVLSSNGLHTVLPLLLFWMIVGLRAAFSFPVDLRARWVFPINLLHSGLYPGKAAHAARTWALLSSVALTAILLGFLLALHWSYWNIFIQTLADLAFCLLFNHVMFLGRTQIPFTRAGASGRSGLTVLLILYGALFPSLLFLTLVFEHNAEDHPVFLVRLALFALALYALLRWLDHLAQQGIIGGFPEDETEPGPQTLGLTQ
jgi:uncharacterized protein YjeT (DUF2065 family)